MTKLTTTWTTSNSIVTGDTIKFTEAVFGGSFRKPRFIGERTITANVMRESYGAAKQQHTFTLEVLECTGTEPLAVGTVTRRKGRNIYRNQVLRLLWNDEAARQVVTAEKHARGDLARAARDERISSLEETLTKLPKPTMSAEELLKITREK